MEAGLALAVLTANGGHLALVLATLLQADAALHARALALTVSALTAGEFQRQDSLQVGEDWVFIVPQLDIVHPNFSKLLSAVCGAEELDGGDASGV